jgi:hypothetical protein
MTGYSEERMDLVKVCEWLTNRGMGATGDLILDNFLYHTWTVGGLTRTDVLKDIFAAIDQSGLLFRELECDVTTYMFRVPYSVAHVD